MNAVGHLKDVVERVADQDHSDPLGLNRLDELQGSGRFLRPECGGRLVHYEHPQIIMIDRTCNGYSLSLSARQAFGRCIKRLELHTKTLHQDPLGLSFHPLVIKQRQAHHAAGQLVSQKHVCCRVKVIGQRKRLINSVDTVRCCLSVICKIHLVAVHEDFARGRLVNAREYLDQGRFPGTVIPNDRENLTGIGLKIDV